MLSYCNYNFYNFISIRFHTNNSKYIKYFNQEYSRTALCSSSAGSCPRIEVYIVKELPDKRNGDIYKKVRFKRLFTYEYLVRNLQSKIVEVYLKRHFIDILSVLPVTAFINQYIIIPITFFKLLDYDILLLHAAGLSYGNNGFIFPAKSGTGKTTLSINLAHRGLKLLSDDILIIDVRNQKVMGFSHPICILSQNNGPNIGSFRLKAVIRIKNILRVLLRIITRVEFRLHARVMPDEIIPTIQYSEPVTYKKVKFLTNKGSSSYVTLEDDKEVNQLVDNIINTSFVPSANVKDDDIDGLNPTSAKNKRLYTYILFDQPELIEEVKKREVKLVKDFVVQLSSAEYINPRDMDKEALDSLAEEF